MTTNLEYEKAHAAIKSFKEGTHSDILLAASAKNANIQLINVMLGNEATMTEEVFAEETIRVSRVTSCQSCDQFIPEGGGTCNQCACPIAIITNMKFKSCPLEKW